MGVQGAWWLTKEVTLLWKRKLGEEQDLERKNRKVKASQMRDGHTQSMELFSGFREYDVDCSGENKALWRGVKDMVVKDVDAGMWWALASITRILGMIQ